jgi:hypothetical protein
VAADLTPLEQAAARVGLPGLKARVVPHDRRRGWWFRWGRGELLVSDRVIDRCPPEDACALLVDEVFARRKHRARWLRLAAAAALAALVVWIVSRAEVASLQSYEAFAEAGGPRPEDVPWYREARVQVGVLFMAGIVAWWLASRTVAAQRADDETVALLGDATPLVRGLNEMNFEEIHLAGKVLPARPDLHRRAERLVAKYRLCDAQPE